MKQLVYILIPAVFLLLCMSGALADPNFALQDTAVRSGSWAEVYAGILEERSAAIQAYQEHVMSITSLSECRPVDLRDLNGDGVPELIFIELNDETEYGFKVGVLRIYTADGNGVHCALEMEPEIDELLYSTYYLAKDGLLTLRFCDTEMDWVVRMRLDPGGHYVSETTLISQEDFSGEGPDQYFLNGKKISAKKYRSESGQIQAEQGELIGSLMVDDGCTGFAYTQAEALKALASGSVAGAGEKWFQELTFSRISFKAGQKLTVYSAPSSKALRGAGGKASVNSGNEIYAAGGADGWILILYELNSGVVRAGYVDTRKIKGDLPSVGELSFAGSRMTLKENTVMTDDPIRGNGSLGKLKKGAEVTCLAGYRGWIYVEAKVSGKTARGFIDAVSLGLE